MEPGERAVETPRISLRENWWIVIPIGFLIAAIESWLREMLRSALFCRVVVAKSAGC